MQTKELLGLGREIWGEQRFNLQEIIVRLGVSIGDLCRVARNAEKDRATANDDEIKKELGNIIFSTIRWCDDLGFDPEECLAKAIEAQKAFAAKNTHR